MKGLAAEFGMGRERLLAIPRWGRVAFAARCARRVREFFASSCLDAGPEFVDVVTAAIEHAENLAAHPPTPPSPAALSTVVEIGLMRAVYRASDTSFLAVERVFRMALHAHRAASCAVFDSIPHNPDKDSDIGDVLGAARIVLQLPCQARAIADFERLEQLVGEGESLPVHPSWFGPMWTEAAKP